jgi:hypothetical protein
MGRIAPALLVAITCAASAGAQELGAALSIYQPFGLDDLDGALPPSAEFRISIPVSRRFALEPFVTIGRNAKGSAGPEGFYGLQIRQRVVSLDKERTYAFATYGLAAYYSRYASLAPVIGQLGFGLHQRLSGRLAFRPEVQLVTYHVVPIGARLVAGLAVDLAR